MILSFSQKLNNKPTYFVEKILASLHGDKDFKGFTLSNSYKHNLDYLETAISKLHTIRKDTSNRWKAGNDIHFSINVRTKNQFQFAPVVKCVSTQKIMIRNIFDDKNGVLIDDKELSKKEIELLAKNDGFENVDDFWNYFSAEDFEGKIIHWTNLKY